MSIASEITRLQGAKADIKSAIEAKGVTVSPSLKLDGYSAKIAEIPTGSAEAVEYDVNFYDYDGKRIASYTITEAKALTELPTPPQHEGLTFQQWNWTLNDIATYDRQYIDIGANYITTDGNTHIFARLTSTDVRFTFYSFSGSAIAVNWGDGTSDSFTYSNNQYNTFTHQYSQLGEWEIVVSYSGSSYYYPQRMSYSEYWRGFIVKEIRLGNDITLELKDTNAGYISRWEWHAMSIPTSLLAMPVVRRCQVKQINIPRNANFVLGTNQTFYNTNLNVSFPRQIKQLSGQLILYICTLSRRLILPDPTDASTIDSTYLNFCVVPVVGMPNVSLAAAGKFWGQNVVLRDVDVPQGWVPNVSVNFNESTLWTADTMVSLFNKLGTTQTAITLTFGAVNLNRLTAEEKAIATAKGYTLA